VTVRAQRLRRPGGTGARRPPFGRLLLAVTVGVIGLGTGPALAQGSGPERPPVKAPSRLGPEPAPVASAATPSTSTSSSTSSSASTPSQATPATSSYQPVAVTTTTPAQPQSRPATSATPKPKPPPPKPKATHAVKTAVTSLAHTIQRPATRIALGAVPAGSGDSNRLLFLGGLALLVLVLGDVAFLAFSARVLREQRLTR
jgi:cytoskeletal protein RodZ